MGQDVVGWGIVGIGTHADLRMAPAFTRAPNSKVMAACSRDARRAEAFAARHGGARAYDSFDAMLADPAVTVVYVATPHALHREFVIKAAGAGKAATGEDGLAMTRLAEAIMRSVREGKPVRV